MIIEKRNHNEERDAQQALACLVTLENTSIVPLYWKHSGLQDGPKPLIPPVLHDG